MYFTFEQIYRTKDYNRNKISTVVRKIINTFAKNTLFPVLRDTYKDLVDQSKQSAPPQIEDTATT